MAEATDARRPPHPATARCRARSRRSRGPRPGSAGAGSADPGSVGPGSARPVVGALRTGSRSLWISSSVGPGSVRGSAGRRSARGVGWRQRVGRWVPESWRAVRVDPGRPGAIALVVVAAVAAVIAAVGVWTGRPQAEPVRGLPGVVVGGAEPTSACPVVGLVDLACTGAQPLWSASPGGWRIRASCGCRTARGWPMCSPRPAAPCPASIWRLSTSPAGSVDGEQVAVGVPPAPDAAGQLPPGARRRDGAAGGRRPARPRSI